MSNKSYVYFAEGNGYIKVGKANNVKRRLHELQIGNPIKLTLISTIECYSEEEAYEVEKYYHTKFQEYCVKGEWFDLPAALLQMLRSPLQLEYKRIRKSRELTEKAIHQYILSRIAVNTRSKSPNVEVDTRETREMFKLTVLKGRLQRAGVQILDLLETKNTGVQIAHKHFLTYVIKTANLDVQTGAPEYLVPSFIKANLSPLIEEYMSIEDIRQPQGRPIKVIVATPVEDFVSKFDTESAEYATNPLQDLPETEKKHLFKNLFINTAAQQTEQRQIQSSITSSQKSAILTVIEEKSGMSKQELLDFVWKKAKIASRDTARQLIAELEDEDKIEVKSKGRKKTYSIKQPTEIEGVEDKYTKYMKETIPKNKWRERTVVSNWLQDDFGIFKKDAELILNNMVQGKLLTQDTVGDVKKVIYIVKE